MRVNGLTGRGGAALAATAVVGALGAGQVTPSAAAPESAGAAIVPTGGIPALVKPAAAALANRGPGTVEAAPPSAPAGDAEARRNPPRPPGTQLVAVRSGQSLPLRARPAGPSVGRVDSRTEFGSDTVLAVEKERGHWLGVSAPQRPNGKLGWIDGQSDAVRLRHTDYSITTDLSKRRIELRRGQRLVRRLPVAIGRPESPTPTGRFSITDKLDGADYSSYFGCCILALSGTQPNPPPGWQGGNRLAIHATSSPDSIGTAASAGCLRAGDADMRAMMKRVPLGTPVRIQK